MLKKIFPTLSRFRLVVQLAMLWVGVYGSVVVGHYMADKISNALPALSCAYDEANGAYCVLIPLQHQMHHRIGEGIVRAQMITMEMVLPVVMTLANFLAFFVALNKAFCGWVCPLGTLQELLGKLGRRLRLPVRRLTGASLARVRPLKWLMLLALVLVLPLLAGLGVLPHSLGNPYCDICPSRLATTLLTADAQQLAIRTSGPIELGLGAIANILFGFVLVAAFTLRQPFCRICPMLALHAVFRRLAPLRLVKKQHERCERCGICAQACPMDIGEIATEHGYKAFHDDCTLCGRCAEFCPDDDVIQIKLGPFALFRASRTYYMHRKKTEAPEGTLKGIPVVAKEARADA